MNTLIMQSSDLRKILSEHPDLPLVILVESDVVQDDYGFWFGSRYYCKLGEVLDYTPTEVSDEHSYTDRTDFEEAVESFVCESAERGLTDEELKERTKAIMDRYEPYWKKAILVYVMG